MLTYELLDLVGLTKHIIGRKFNLIAIFKSIMFNCQKNNNLTILKII